MIVILECGHSKDDVTRYSKDNAGCYYCKWAQKHPEAYLANHIASRNSKGRNQYSAPRIES